jgi:serine/threonine protein kinase
MSPLVKQYKIPSEAEQIITAQPTLDGERKNMERAAPHAELPELQAGVRAELRGAGIKFTYPSGSRPLAGYTIKRGIGRGGFGEVYYAVSDGGKEVALKLIRRNLDVELRGVSHCLNLKHPNLVGLYDIRCDEHDDSWVVMEYVGGECLEEIIARNPDGMPIPEVLAWIHGIGAGVAYLHDRGIVHRDLKPGNIFCDEGIVKIGDYGLSKFISASRRSGQTESVGTVHYMAPEVANGRYGKEIDIYALGIMLYEMLTGHVPFDGESVGEVLMKHLTATPDVSRLQEPFRSVVAKALAKDPDKRLRSVHDLLVALPQPAAPQVLVNPLATKPPLSSPPPAPSELVAAQVVDEGEEPVMRVLGQAYGELRKSWRKANLNTPSKVALLVVGVYMLISYAPFWMPGAFAIVVAYAIYLVIRAVVIASSPTAAAPVATPVPPRPPAAPRVAELRPVRTPLPAVPVPRPLPQRRRAMPVRFALPQRTVREKLTELLGSMLLASLVAGVLCVVMALLVDGQPQWNQLLWLGIVGTAGAWLILIPAKFWEGRESDSMHRRFVMLLIGLALGLVGFVADEFLRFNPNWSIVSLPVDAMAGYKQTLFEVTGSPNLKGYLAYFAFLFPVLRWWVQADPLRSTRVSIWGTFCCVFWAWMLQVAWPFPQPWGAMVAAIIAISVQLSSPWVSHEARRASLAAAHR